MRAITAHRLDGRRGDPVRPAIVIEGVVALLGLIAFVGAVCAVVTWALVHLIAGFVA